MDGDDRNSGTSGGFDDWLSEEPGPDTDPYAALSGDDPEAEIADWMAFTQGEAEQPPSPDEADEAEDVAEPVHDTTPSEDADEDPEDDVIVDLTEETPGSDGPFEEPDETGELQVVALDEAEHSDEPDEPDEADEADEAEVVDLTPAASVDDFEFDGGGKADTEELPILAGADVVSASITNDPPSDAHGTLDDPDAIVEMPAIVVDEDPDEVAFDDAAPDDTSELSTEEDDAILEVDDTGELELFAASSDVSADDDVADEPDDEGHIQDSPTVTGADAFDPDDTGELEVDDILAVGAAGSVAAAALDPDPEPERDSPFDLSQEDYLHTATREHEGLAAAIAEADDEDIAQVALSAPIPGMEETVIGFEDVVEAEGHGRVRARGAGDLVARVITAVVLIAALGASLLWQPALLALATVVFVIAAGEFYTALAKAGRHPIGLFGFIGIVGASIGAFFWGAIAIPISFGLVVAALLLYYAVVPGRRDPMGNLALTITVMAWVGLGAYAMLIAVSDDYRPLIIGVVVLVAAMDIAQYFVGRGLGRHPLAPWVSPKKTIEGLVGGVFVALSLGALLHFVPPFELTSGLVLGAAVAILVPLGDLAVSAAKRSFDIKDMGSILPGHGGFLDRIDGLLFVIPAAWAIFLWAGIL